MQVTARLAFSGTLEPAPFLAFAADRARRLALDLVVEHAGPARIVVTVGGEAVLVEAFELACSLGPVSCLVQEVQRLDHEDTEAGGEC